MAYSIYGQTASLSGEPETDVVVEAVGKGSECEQYQEEAVSDNQGAFRIRGLLPKVGRLIYFNCLRTDLNIHWYSFLYCLIVCTFKL